MSENRPPLHKWFHNALIWFFLWVFAALAVVSGVRDILAATENGMDLLILFILLDALLMILGVFLVKVRFDLAAFRKKAPAELRAACFAAAAIVAGKCLLLNAVAEEVGTGDWFPAVIFALWGVTLYNYYHQRAYLFTE
ncbi:MAG: hypothetical protein IJS53_05245 [Clostridia bacterium]|nr:hypothetical protein [Clostridia bacterium]